MNGLSDRKGSSVASAMAVCRRREHLVEIPGCRVNLTACITAVALQRWHVLLANARRGHVIDEALACLPPAASSRLTQLILTLQRVVSPEPSLDSVCAVHGLAPPQGRQHQHGGQSFAGHHFYRGARAEPLEQEAGMPMA